jgi:hypothetical protein
MNEKLIIRQWEDATIDLANHFALKYFDKDCDIYFVADDVGGVLFINDYFFNMKDIVDFLKSKYSKDKLFEYYQYALDCH